MTVFAAYTNFYVAEAICGVSGVLAVVTMGVGLSATFWPFVCSKETMQHTWHIFEWILNTLCVAMQRLPLNPRRNHETLDEPLGKRGLLPFACHPLACML